MLGEQPCTTVLKYQVNAAAAGINDAKNIAVLHPLSTPVLYKHAMEDMAPEVKDGRQPYTLLRRISNQETGFDAASYLDPETGHAVLIFRGTNFPWGKDGSGLSAFWKDFKAVMASKLGMSNPQLPEAEQAYLDLMHDPAIKSVEVLGYSLGSIYVNFLSAKYGARGTTIADLGLAERALSSAFNAASGDNDNDDASREAAYKRLKRRTVNLVLKDDVIVKIFGAGQHLGREIDLDTHKVSDYEGAVHFVEAYIDKVQDHNSEPHLPGMGSDVRPA